SRPSRSSWARNTSPMPPAPRSERISYGPTRVPGLMAMGSRADYGSGWIGSDCGQQVAASVMVAVESEVDHSVPGAEIVREHRASLEPPTQGERRIFAEHSCVV